MRRMLCVLIGLFLTSVTHPSPSPAQDAGDRGRSQDPGFQLRQNYPNPFNPETRIPFGLGEELFADGGPTVVTIRIYNVLQQFVASPTALNNPGGEGLPMVNMEYSAPGSYEAYWDGRDSAGNQVASGIYFLQLVVNGRSQVIKMFVTK